MGIFVSCYILFCIALGHGVFPFQGEWWYNTCFFLGGFSSQLITKNNKILYLGAVYAASIISAYILHLVDSKIVKIIKHK